MHMTVLASFFLLHMLHILLFSWPSEDLFLGVDDVQAITKNGQMSPLHNFELVGRKQEKAKVSKDCLTT